MITTIPQVIIVDSKEVQLLNSMTKDEIQDKDKFKTVLDGLKEFKKSGTNQQTQDKALQWYHKDSNTFDQGVFVKLSDTHLTLLQGGNSNIDFAIEKFSPGSIAYAKKLQALATSKSEASDSPATATPAPGKPITYETEDWTSSKGQTIKARFVKLEGEKITLLLMPSKKTSSFNIKILSDKSIARARELSSQRVMSNEPIEKKAKPEK